MEEDTTSIKSWTVSPPMRYIIFTVHQQAEMEEAMARLEVTVVDGSRRLEDLKALEDKWMCDLGTMMGPQGLNRKNEVLGHGRLNLDNPRM